MVEVSSPARIVYPEAGTTKGEVVAHYRDVADRLLWHIADRPLTLERFPQGTGGKGFMQKNAADYFPDFIARFSVPRQDGAATTHPVVHDVRGIEYLANQNTITFHMPTTTVGDFEHPDRVIIDLDPPEGGLAIVRTAAWATKALFDQLGLISVPVTTGSKGYHVTAIVDRSLSEPEVDEFGQLAAALLAHRHPDELTTEFRKANRHGRVFCDWLRNRGGSTSVAPWSLRPRRRPTVAVPITWEQLEETAPDAFELGSIPETDQLRRAAGAPGNLTGALQTLRQLAADAGVQPEPFDRFRS